MICDLGMLIVLTACSLDQDHLAEEQDRMLEEPRQPRPAHTKASRWSTQGLGCGGDWADTEDSSYVVSTALK